MSDRLDLRDIPEDLKGRIRIAAEKSGFGKNMSAFIRNLIIKELKKLKL